MMTMQSRTRRASGLGIAAVLVAAAGIAFAQPEAPTPAPADTAAASTESPEAVIQNWPKHLQSTAKVLIERYGRPSQVDATQLVWNNNGPWRKTVLHKDGFTRAALGRDRDHLEQVISYRVPEEKVADLERFDKRVEVDQATGMLTSRADTESMNYLALNLADDIVKGQRTVQDARGFYKKVKTLERMGKASPYLEGLIFVSSADKAGESGTMESEESPDQESPNTR